MTRRSWWVAAVAALVMTLVAACTMWGDDMETKTEQEAKALVQQRAEQVTELIGAGQPKFIGLDPTTCTGRFGEEDRRIFSVQGTYRLPLEASRQIEVLARVKEHWKAQGYTIPEDRTIDAISGILSATAADGYDFSLITAGGSTALGYIINSPCFTSPVAR